MKLHPLVFVFWVIITILLFFTTIYPVYESPSQAKYELSLYSDIYPQDNGNIYIYVYKDQDPDLYKHIYVLDRVYKTVIIEFAQECASYEE